MRTTSRTARLNRLLIVIHLLLFSMDLIPEAFVSFGLSLATQQISTFAHSPPIYVVCRWSTRRIFVTCCYNRILFVNGFALFSFLC